MNEIWKPIDEYKNLYEVSNKGNIRSVYRYKKILKQKRSKSGYMYIYLCKDKNIKVFSVHRLVAKAFIANPQNKPCVNHIDGNKANNNLSNLEWVTYSENEKHSYNVLKKKVYGNKHLVGDNRYNSKHVIQCSLDGTIIKEYESRHLAATTLGISAGNIWRVLIGRGYTAGGYKWMYK